MGRDIRDSLDPSAPAPRRARTPGFVFPHQSFPRGRRYDGANPGACGTPLVRFYYGELAATLRRLTAPSADEREHPAQHGSDETTSPNDDVIESVSGDSRRPALSRLRTRMRVRPNVRITYRGGRGY